MYIKVPNSLLARSWRLPSASRGLSLVLGCNPLYLGTNNHGSNPSSAWDISDFFFCHISLTPASKNYLLLKAHMIRSSPPGEYRTIFRSVISNFKYVDKVFFYHGIIYFRVTRIRSWNLWESILSTIMGVVHKIHDGLR